MSFDPEYEEFLAKHTDGNPVFEYGGCHYRLKTREGLFARENSGRLSVPFISCLVACRQRLRQCGYSEADVSAIDGTAIGEYSGDILFISHETGAVCKHCGGGTADVDEVASSIGEFLAGIVRL